jgi:hypothetical protein
MNCFLRPEETEVNVEFYKQRCEQHPSYDKYKSSNRWCKGPVNMVTAQDPTRNFFASQRTTEMECQGVEIEGYNHTIQGDQQQVPTAAAEA